MDYRKLGLKCGIEIHQQLDTRRKLFCTCAPRLSKGKAGINIRRRLRPVAGETGAMDRAALHEFLRSLEFEYKFYPEESCLVEADEEPPRPLDSEALDIALTVSRMLKCEVPDEIHVMRKHVLDGSNTTGFQRTALVGMHGEVETGSGRVGIANVALEEESCQIVERRDGLSVYGLDRLGIPLVEIGTEPDIRSPEHAKEVAAKIGMILRSTGKVKRGIGTIRQDINISIRDGARVEIKGAQELRLIPEYVEKEVMRQRNLIEIREELKKKGFRGMKPEIREVTELFRESESRIVKGRKVFGMRIPELAGMLKRNLTPTRTLGNELANYVRVKSGARGFIHSDEDLGRYSFEREFSGLRKKLNAGKNDCAAIVVGEEEMCRAALEALAERVNMLLEGVPEETRKALENGDSEYMRPLPGAARMYPETDVLPVRVRGERIKEIDRNLPELLEEKAKRYMKEYSLNAELSSQLVRSGMWRVFERAVRIGAEPKFAAGFLTASLSQVPGNVVESVGEEKLAELISSGKGLGKEALLEAVAKLGKNRERSVKDVLGESLSDEDIRKAVREILKDRRILESRRPEKAAMGEVMRKLRGKAAGSVVMRIVLEELGKKGEN